MRKFFLVFSFLPFFVLGDTFTESQVKSINQCRIYTFTSTTNTVYNVINTLTYSTLQSSYIPHTFGIILRDNGSFRYPMANTNSSSSSSIRFSVRASIDSSSLKYYSPLAFEPLLKIYTFAASFFGNGYRGSGFTYIYKQDSYNYINVNIPLLISDVLSSTNTVYHSLLLSKIHLISSSVSNIDSSIISFQSDFNNFLDIYKSSSPCLDPFNSITNSLRLTDGTYLSSLRDYVNDELNPSDFDLSTDQGRSDYLNQARVLSQSLNSLYSLSQLGTGFKYLPDDESNDLNNLLNHVGSEFNKNVNDSLDGIQTSIDGSIDAIRTLNTNWVEEAKRELGTLNTSVSNQNITIARVISHSNAVKVVGADGGAIQVTGAVTLDTHGEDLHVWLDGPVSLDVPTLDALTSDNDLIEQTLIDFKSLFEQWYKDDQDNSWLKFFEMARDWRINEIADNTSNQLEVAWEIHTAATNILANMTNDYKSLLLTDYDQFVSNGVYDSMVSLSRSFNDDCLKYGSATYSDMLDSLGLGSGEGRWWQYITAHLGLMGNISVTNYYMMSYVFSNLVETIQYANDQFEEEGGFLGQATKLIKSIPKEDDVVSQIDNITNTINSAAVGFNEVYTDLGSTSNQFNQAISTYYVKKDLPDNIQLQILPGIEPFRIPVGERRELFDLLRMGMAFAISIVNIILLPKFILKLFTLFFGVVDSQIKIASMDQTSV